MADQRFLPQHHIRRGADFQRAYRRRVSASDRVLLIFGCQNGLDHPRLGLSVSRKVGNAVLRNRWKRLIRDAFRLSRETLPRDLDLVVIPRQGDAPRLEDVRASLPRLAARVASRLAKGSG